MPLTDSHCHLDSFETPGATPETLDTVLDRAAAAGVNRLLAIGIGDGPNTMHHALDIARSPRTPGQPAIFASAGIHPQEAHQATSEHLTKLLTLTTDRKCIAIGEIGLDYYHVDNPSISIQHQAFLAQLDIAAAVRKPILIHCRTSELAKPEAKAKFGPADTWNDLLDLIAQHWTPHALGGIMHCFSGDLTHARRSLDAGFHLSFAGNLTYPKSTTIREAAAFAPADRILVETDAPFLAPIPLRGQTNEPALITHTARALANLRGISPEDLAALTSANFTALFPSTLP
jgi:TatD DNase family protein